MKDMSSIRKKIIFFYLKTKMGYRIYPIGGFCYFFCVQSSGQLYQGYQLPIRFSTDHLQGS